MHTEQRAAQGGPGRAIEAAFGPEAELHRLQGPGLARLELMVNAVFDRLVAVKPGEAETR